MNRYFSLCAIEKPKWTKDRLRDRSRVRFWVSDCKPWSSRRLEPSTYNSWLVFVGVFRPGDHGLQPTIVGWFCGCFSSRGSWPSTCNSWLVLVGVFRSGGHGLQPKIVGSFCWCFSSRESWPSTFNSWFVSLVFFVQGIEDVNLQFVGRFFVGVLFYRLTHTFVGLWYETTVP